MLSILFSYKGRINRVQYWVGCIALGVMLFLAFFLAILLTGATFSPSKTDPSSILRALSGFALALFAIMLFYCWSAFAIQTKRFHDRGRSGLWSLLPLGASVPLMFAIVGGIVSGKPQAQIVQEATFWFNILSLINLAMLVDLGLLPGVEGPNKYGDPPGGGMSGPSRSSPSYSAPAAPKPGNAQAAMSSLMGAQSAMDRAIAERAKQAQRPQQPAMRPAVAAQPAGPRPTGGGAPSFGRRTAQ